MKIAIIWWWAAGMMAAATILEQIQSEYIDDINIPQGTGKTVLLFEKNKILGAKVRISGWGRCNITTNITNTKELLTKYPRGSEFVEYAIRNFTPKSIYKRFESNWLVLKIQPDNRVFPASNDANDVVKCFEDIYQKYPDFIHIYTNTSITDITKVEDKFCISTQDNTYIVDKIIITTGGVAYRHTWSTWEWYTFAEKFWHKITRLSPSLNSFLLKNKNIYTSLQWLCYLSKITYLSNNQTKYIYGEIVWTHFGISGPGIFALASHLAYHDLSFDEENKSDNNIYISYLNHDSIYRKNEIENYISQNHKKQIKTMLSSMIPDRLADMILEIANIDWLISCWNLNKIQKKYIYNLLSEGINVQILERRPGDEFVTAGWIDTSLINQKTMESIICKWLYFAGEIIDVDGYTWGFNLTACRATGRLSAINAIA